MKSLKRIAKGAIITLATIVALGGSVQSNQNKPVNINKVYLTSCIDNQICSTAPKDVTLENKVKLNLVAEGEENGKKIYFSNSDNIKINGKKIGPAEIRKWNSRDVDVKWYKVESEEDVYQNASLDRKSFSWDTPSYKETLVEDDDKWSIPADAHPTNITKDFNKGLGTMRYKVEVDFDGKKMSTPGKESTNIRGINDDVHRVSFRKDDSFIGWLTSYFNLPYIFGSAGNPIENHQTEKYIGADCADLIVGAYRRAGHDIPYTYAAGLVKYADEVVKEKDLLTDGKNFYNGHKLLKFGKDVKEGDLILFGKWHIGVIVEDKSSLFSPTFGGPDGIFNKYDEMIHTNFDVPGRAQVGDYGPFSILRFKENKNEK
jgi:cell wall-associated NlpC family hydrolase